MVRGNGVESDAGGKRGRRGGRDSCHTITNTSLCEWTLRDEGWVGGGLLPQPCHSGCYRVLSSRPGTEVIR